jgi:hypothetical protein
MKGIIKQLLAVVGLVRHTIKDLTHFKGTMFANISAIMSPLIE